MINRVVLFAFLSSLPMLCLALSENDFAYIADLEIEGSKPFYELEVPAVVYDKISRPDLGDLRVLNAAGQVVPHGLRLADDEKTSETKSQQVPFFPLYQKSGQPISDLHLNIKRDASGEIIDIRSSQQADDSADQLIGYIVNLDQWQHPIDKLKLSWDASTEKQFIRQLSISVSEDLNSWRRVASGRKLVNLAYQGNQLMQNMIDLDIGKTRYLRILYDDKKPGLVFTSIEVNQTNSSQQQKRVWQPVTVAAGKEAGDYHFYHPAKSLIRQLRIKLPENNTLVWAQALSRANEEQPWRLHRTALLYRLSVDGVDVEQTILPISHSRDSHWILRVNQQGGGLGSGLPTIELGWQPQRLVFVARGEAPYRVVWGSARVKPVLQDARQLLVGAQGDGASMSNLLGQAHWQADSVRAVNREVLMPEAEAVNWRQWILWIVLVAAAAILIWMAVRLMGKMTTNTD